MWLTVQNKIQKFRNDFSILCWNIRNPSLKRASKQVDWLVKRAESVFVLTESKRSKGCQMLEQYFQTLGYSVFSSKPEKKDYGVIVISKNPMKPSEFWETNYLNSRGISLNMIFPETEIELIGVYVPSRDSSPEKIKRKKRFLELLLNTFKKKQRSCKRILCGDFNILEPNHVPHYPFFEEWEYDFYKNLNKFQLMDAFRYITPDAEEYSWVGRTGNGYRYDHCFVSPDLVSSVKECFYLHEPRHKKLSDHSALIIEFSKLC